MYIVSTPAPVGDLAATSQRQRHSSVTIRETVAAKHRRNLIRVRAGQAGSVGVGVAASDDPTNLSTLSAQCPGSQSTNDHRARKPPPHTALLIKCQLIIYTGRK